MILNNTNNSSKIEKKLVNTKNSHKSLQKTNTFRTMLNYFVLLDLKK